MNTRKTAMAVALTALLSAALVAGCGDDDSDARSSSVGNGTDVAFAMGMDADMPMLRGAAPFDRAFIDTMIPHHQGAVRMVRQQLAKGRHPRLRRMAREIVAAQSREIAQMRNWRERWYE